ncbi:unnamed protein product [Lepeophtheirus salmonis]|uniref:(salmon louse) hypothetical protein n=1 Tax=Lepeophtheirus salmonis TaxID=72036 RepID=A0A7R8CF03_LEPSM|nr:unnamed protein product [Lepeophtheirus salmonis]CAF2801747.1 unnamed protein product [Lepeophtheirus salmonis]
MHSIHKVSSTFIVMEYSYIFTISFLLVCVLWNKEVKGNPIVSCPTVDGETCVFPLRYMLCYCCFGDATMLEKFHPKFVTENVMRALDDEPESMEDKMEEGETKDSEEDTEENKTEEGENNDSEEDTEDKETEEDENDDSEDDKEDQSTEEDEMKDSEDDKEDQTTEEDEMKDSEEDKRSCTYAGVGHYSWCATAVDPSNMEYTSYGFCSKDCEKEEIVPEDQCATFDGTKCEFPFTYNKQTYNECTGTDNSGLPWCATKVLTITWNI